jgi:hypothetical protein
MFAFSKRKIAEIEKKVNKAFKFAGKFKQIRVTKLENEAAVTNNS